MSLRACAWRAACMAQLAFLSDIRCLRGYLDFRMAEEIVPRDCLQASGEIVIVV